MWLHESQRQAVFWCKTSLSLTWSAIEVLEGWRAALTEPSWLQQMGLSPPEFDLTCLVHITVPRIWQCGSHYGKLHSTVVRSEIDSDSVHWREWPNYLTIHQLQQPPRKRLKNRAPDCTFYWVSPKIEFPLTDRRALWGSFPFNSWHEAELPCRFVLQPM